MSAKKTTMNLSDCDLGMKRDRQYEYLQCTPQLSFTDTSCVHTSTVVTRQQLSSHVLRDRYSIDRRAEEQTNLWYAKFEG
jgi:hypothetical protein